MSASVHHTPWECGMAGARDTESVRWDEVTCGGCLSLADAPVAAEGEMIHFYGHPKNVSAPCAASLADVAWSSDWSEVTCAACKVSEPAVNNEALLAECESAMARCREGVAALEQEYSHAESLRDRLRSGTSEPLSQDQGVGVVAVTLITPQAFLDGLAGFAERQWAGRAPWHP